MIELIFILVACAIAYRIAFPANKAPAFVSQVEPRPVVTTVGALTSQPSSVVTVKGHPENLTAIRKQLAADEKLTPELKAAFDAIQAALEGK